MDIKYGYRRVVGRILGIKTKELAMGQLVMTFPKFYVRHVPNGVMNIASRIHEEDDMVTVVDGRKLYVFHPDYKPWWVPNRKGYISVVENGNTVSRRSVDA
jgi:hypothetical protein